MASKKLPESEASPETVSDDVEDWFDQFQLHHSIAFQDRCRSLPNDASHAAIQRATIEAFVDTLSESGAPPDLLLEAIGHVQLKSSSEPWTNAKNQRRVELIDRDIQGVASFEEQFELARLTALMRAEYDNEENLPMAGAKQLHEKLLKMDEQEKSR